MANKSNKDKLIAEYEKKQKQDKLQKIILIIIILILLILFWVCYKMGKINLRKVETVQAQDAVQLVQVTDEDLEIGKNTKLDIFNNKKFNNQKIIAPKSNGTYTFCVENISGKDVTYSINFEDEMETFVNMKYRLKIDNEYVKGDNDTYVDVKNLNLSEIVALKDSMKLFTLEWYWKDDDVNDTKVGTKKDDQYYTLKFEILAEEYLR